MMKVCQINIFYNQGSTGRIVASIHRNLEEQGHLSYVFYGLGPKDKRKNICKISSDRLAHFYGKMCRIIGLRFACAHLETLRLIIKVESIRPDIVHIHCMNCYYLNPSILFWYLGIRNYRVLITNHADISFTANCDCAFDCTKWKSGCGNCPYDKGNFHSRFFDRTHRSWMSFYKLYHFVKRLYVSSVSAYTNKRAIESPFFDKAIKFRVIKNGIDTSLFYYRPASEHSIKTIVYVTPNYLDPNKGFNYLVKIAKLTPEYKYLVIGVNQLHNMPTNLSFMGRINNQQELAKIYSSADLTILTSKQESFSLVCAESLCCGTPVLGFRSGGPESISLHDYSSFVDYGDIDALLKEMNRILEIKWDKNIISEEATRVYSNQSMANEYLSYYQEMLLES